MDFTQVIKACFDFATVNNGTIQSFAASDPDKLEVHSRTERTQIFIGRDSINSGHWRVEQMKNAAGDKTSTFVTVAAVDDLTAQLLGFWGEQGSTSLWDTIQDIFSKYLPSVPSIIAADFACAMHNYHKAFQSIRDSTMNYEALSEYKDKSYIMHISRDQFWPYTPHFRKVMALVIETLFQTTIVSMGTNACTMEQTLIWVGDRVNRWIMYIEQGTSDEHLIRLLMSFPTSNTDIIIKEGRG